VSFNIHITQNLDIFCAREEEIFVVSLDYHSTKCLL